MTIFIVLLLIFMFSFVLALRSMGDFDLPKEVRRLLKINKVSGSILFFKDKVKHYKN